MAQVLDHRLPPLVDPAQKDQLENIDVAQNEGQQFVGQVVQLLGRGREVGLGGKIKQMLGCCIIFNAKQNVLFQTGDIYHRFYATNLNKLKICSYRILLVWLLVRIQGKNTVGGLHRFHFGARSRWWGATVVRHGRETRSRTRKSR